MPLPIHLKISFKCFYTDRVKRGTMPVKSQNGRWYFSSEKVHFTNFLEQFCEEDRKYIQSGVKLLKPIESTTSKIAELLNGMNPEQVKLLMEEVTP